ncbi:DNA methyltransferase [Mesorhizobium sp. PUT5]|uniref:DNA methyltransferase n=1 Tax=Mesorhizobium sp. PUT5 TaxID=3454629 RepID=UPI003FA4C52A
MVFRCGFKTFTPSSLCKRERNIRPASTAQEVETLLSRPSGQAGEFDPTQSGGICPTRGGWLHPAFNQMHRVLKDGGFAVSFYGWNKVDLFMDAWKAAGFRVVGHIVFRKRYASSSKFLRYQHEQAYLLAKGNVSLPENPIPDVIDFPYAGNKLHPTQKPVEALAPLIEAFTKPGDLVLDPFSGSGSTLAAAQQLGRDWIGIELDSRHHQTASKRLAWMQQQDGRAAA